MIVVNYIHNWIAGVRKSIKDYWIMDIHDYIQVQLYMALHH